MKVHKLLIILIISVFPICVFALNGSINVNKSNMTLEIGGKESFTVSADNATGKISFSSNNLGVCTIDKTSTWLDKDSVTVNVTAVSAGSCTITIDINGGSYDETPIITTKTINITVNTPKSGDNSLSDLKVDGKTVSGFSSSNTNYNLGDNSGASINITATAADSKANISGTGTKNLNYGNNSFDIVVTAENGSKKTYTIKVNKPDPRSTNNYLKSLSVDKEKISFDKNTTNYTIKLEHSVNEITITATAEDSKAKVDGAGVKQLNDYINEFKIVVTAENGSNKEYIIKAIRKDKDGNYGKLNEDNSVKSFSIKDYDFMFDKDTKKYNILVEESVNDLEINVEPNDATATVTIENNKDLKPGLNKVIIKIVAENGNENEYLLNVYKMGEEKKEIVAETQDTEKESNNNSIILIIGGVVICILIIVICVLIIKNRKLSKMNESNDDATSNSDINNDSDIKTNDSINTKPVVEENNNINANSSPVPSENIIVSPTIETNPNINTSSIEEVLITEVNNNLSNSSVVESNSNVNNNPNT